MMPLRVGEGARCPTRGPCFIPLGLVVEERYRAPCSCKAPLPGGARKCLDHGAPGAHRVCAGAIVRVLTPRAGV